MNRYQRFAVGKYRNLKTEVDGEKFDSRKEARRYQELLILEKAGEISGLERQKPFVLVPALKDKKTGKVLERAVIYKADFVYRDQSGRTVVEDVKSEITKTPAYIIKRKLMLWVHGLRIREV